MAKLNFTSAAASLSAINVGLTVEQAVQVFQQVETLVDTAETIYSGLAGNEKFQAVVAGVKGFVEVNFPEAAHRVDDIVKHIAPFVNMVVAVYRFRSLFSSVVHQVEDAVHGA